jgi:4'-phosphopantetheinyl transferase
MGYLAARRPKSEGKIMQMSIGNEEQKVIPDDVRVLHVSFDFSLSLEATLFDVLSKDERDRALHFVHHVDSIRYATTRATLRKSIGSVIGETPANIQFSYSALGRPLLREGKLTTGIDFNVSHSGAHALIAWSTKRHVGIDIEQKIVEYEWEPLLSRVCGEADFHQVRATSHGRKSELLFDIWVAKEALLKTSGDGIIRGLTDFSVASSNVVSPLIQGISDRARVVQQLEACWLRGIDGYAACLAWSKLA